ncbi:MAG: hypothetical protein SGARI_001222 [Bacillariaceae sp.]
MAGYKESAYIHDQVMDSTYDSTFPEDDSNSDTLLPIERPAETSVLRKTLDEGEILEDISLSSGTATPESSFKIRAHDKEEELIAPEEERAVRWTRGIFVAVIVLTAVAASVTLFFKASQAQHDDFRRTFENQAMAVKTSLESHIQGQAEAMQAMSTAISVVAATRSRTDAMTDQGSWPAVTIPNFEQIGSTLGLYTDQYLMAPVITDDESRRVWESFAAANKGGVDWERWHSKKRPRQGLSSDMLPLNNDSALTGEAYAPVWQQHPTNPMLVGYDLATDPSLQSAIKSVLSAKKAALGQTILHESRSSPLLPMVYPIFDKPAEMGNDTAASVVGLLVGLSRWDAILSPNSNSIEATSIAASVEAAVPCFNGNEEDATVLSFLIGGEASQPSSFVGKVQGHDSRCLLRMP